MKILSVRQPWAWLIVAGHKDIENRKWRTSYRGPEKFTGKNGLNFSGPAWKLGGKSLRTKNIRSATPRGFAKAVFAANS